MGFVISSIFTILFITAILVIATTFTLVRYASKVPYPLFLIAGSRETHPRLRDCATDVYDTVRNNPDAHLVIVDKAPRHYTGAVAFYITSLIL